MPDADPRRMISAVTRGMQNAELKRKGIIPCDDCHEQGSTPTQVKGGMKVEKEDL
jgi:hypothetical protein